jgi:Aspartyl protease
MNPLGDYLARFDYTVIPLRRGPTGHLQVEGALNDAAASLYLDTGAGQTVLDLGQARSRGLPLTEAIRPAGGLGTTTMAAYRTVLRRLSLHTIEEADFPVAVIDLSHVNQGLRARGAALMDGVLGADLLEAREAVIDYKHLQLFLKRIVRRRAA